MFGSHEFRLVGGRRKTRSVGLKSVALVLAGLTSVLGLSVSAADAEPALLSVTPAVVEVGGSVTLKVVGLLSTANRVDFSVGGLAAGSSPASGGSASLVVRLWDAGTKVVEGRVVTYINGVEQVAVLTSTVQAGSAVTTLPGTTNPGTTNPGTTNPPTTLPTGTGVLTVQPRVVAPRDFVTLTVSGLKPAEGVVDFTGNGAPLGSVSVNSAGVATITVQFWAYGSPLIIATWRRYVAGALVSQTFTDEVIIPVPSSTLPVTTSPVTTTAPATTLPPTTAGVATLPITTLPPTGGTLSNDKFTYGPVITGRAKVGETLTCGGLTVGLGQPQVQWFDDQGQPIAGAATHTFVVRPQDAQRSVSCVSTSGGLSTGSQPMIISNLDGPLPQGTVSTTRIDAVSGVSFTCAVQATNATVSGFRFIKLLQLSKGGPTIPVTSDGGLRADQAGISMSCGVFLKNDAGVVEILGSADTRRLLVSPLITGGRPRVGRTLTCEAPRYSPALQVLSVDWTLDSAPFTIGGTRTTLGPTPYVVSSADLGKQVRCRTRFVAQTPPFYQGPLVEQWDYSSPLTVTN